MDETLFKQLSDADEISTLIHAIRTSVDPLSHGQSNKQVAVIIKRIGKPGAALRIPAWQKKRTKSIQELRHRHTEQSDAYSPIHRDSTARLRNKHKCVNVERVSNKSVPGPDVGGGGGPWPFAGKIKSISASQNHPNGRMDLMALKMINKD